MSGAGATPAPGGDAIEVRDNPARRRFEAVVDGHLAIAQYRLHDAAIEFTHTEVPRPLQGRGVGAALARAGLAHARAAGLAVIPTCPFFETFIRRHPEYRDLLQP